MENKQIILELDYMIRIIKQGTGINLSELSLSMIVDLLQNRDSAVQNKVVDVIEAILDSNRSYNMERLISWDNVDKLPLAIRKRIYIAALKHRGVALERVFNFPETEIKDLLLAYSDYRIEDNIWNRILDWKNRALATEWMLALVPNHNYLSEKILNKLISSFLIDRVAILNKIHGQQMLYESNLTNIVKLFEHADAKEILMKYWYYKIYENVWLIIVNEFGEADIRDLILASIEKGYCLGTAVFEKLVTRFSPESKTVDEIALKHVEKFCPGRGLALIFYKLPSRQKMLDILSKYDNPEKHEAYKALSYGW